MVTYSSFHCVAFRLLEKIHLKEDKQGVAGLVTFKNKIYVMIENGKQIRVFSGVMPFDELENEKIELLELKEPFDMTVARACKSIVVSDCSLRCLWITQLPEKKVTRLNTGDLTPLGLSTNQDGDLIVIVRFVDRCKTNRFKLSIYKSSDVKLIKTLELPTSIADVTSNAIQACNGNFIVAHRDINGECFLSELSSDGKEVVQTFDPRSSNAIEQNNWHPVHMTMDATNTIYVADSYDKYSAYRVFLVNQDFTDIKPLSKTFKRYTNPLTPNTLHRLWYENELKQLIIGQAHWAVSYIHVYNNSI